MSDDKHILTFQTMAMSKFHLYDAWLDFHAWIDHHDSFVQYVNTQLAPGKTFKHALSIGPGRVSHFMVQKYNC